MSVDFKNTEFYENRELSWIKFNRRILDEARDKSLPILERIKFLAITSSNLDEFFMVRVASLKDMVNADYDKEDLAGMTAKEQLSAILKETGDFMSLQGSTYNRSLLPLLEKEGIRIIDTWEDLDSNQAEYVDNYFRDTVYPVLTPLAVDSSRPFPLIANKSLNIAGLVTKKAPSKLVKEKFTEGEHEFVTVQVPSVLPRFISIPNSDDNAKNTFILLEQVIEKNLPVLFLNYNVECAFPYRIMRNADMNIDEDEAPDLLEEIQKQLKRRQWGEVIRLEVEEGIDSRVLAFLRKNLNVPKESIYKINGPIDLTFLMKMYGIEGYDKLRNKPYVPKYPKRLQGDDDIFTEIKKGDIFLHHPYESFTPVVDFIRQASEDPLVLAIKQTLYRVSGNSPIIAALARAAENGKQVTVLVELKARFDEENNIVWAKKLEQAGCHVIYGLVGLKTHCKIALVVRKEDDGIKRYIHLGTGNYNDSTAKLYTDCGIMTCNEMIGEDATAVFNMLSGYSEPARWHKLAVAPIWMRDKFYQLIDREIAHAKAGRSGRIVGKMNSLCDQGIIAKLYEASAAGVQIDLIVRGICSLKVGIPGVSENIRVSSIVGNFLEHSRIYYFYNDGMEEIFMGSADWMPRNLDRRVEIIFPVEDEEAKNRARHILEINLKDNKKAYYMDENGAYNRLDKRGKKLIGAQETFVKEASQKEDSGKKGYSGRRFTPKRALKED